MGVLLLSAIGEPHLTNARGLSPEITREALATVVAMCISPRCPIGDPDIAPGLVTALVLTMRRPLRLLGLRNPVIGLFGLRVSGGARLG
jgi:hypothetical protein